MNKIEFFRTILNTNPDFNKATINKYITYFESVVIKNSGIYTHFSEKDYQITSELNSVLNNKNISIDKLYNFTNKKYELIEEFDENNNVINTVVNTSLSF